MILPIQSQGFVRERMTKSLLPIAALATKGGLRPAAEWGDCPVSYWEHEPSGGAWHCTNYAEDENWCYFDCIFYQI